MAFDNSPKRKRQAVRRIYVWEHLRYHQGVMSLLKKTMTAIGNVLHIYIFLSLTQRRSSLVLFTILHVYSTIREEAEKPIYF